MLQICHNEAKQFIGTNIQYADSGGDLKFVWKGTKFVNMYLNQNY